MKRTVRWSLAKAKDCFDHEGRKIVAITLTTIDGTDETYAAKRAEAKSSPYIAELLRCSLVSYEREVVDGSTETVAIVQPFEAYEKWASKARAFVNAAFQTLCVPGDEELADFFASASEA